MRLSILYKSFLWENINVTFREHPLFARELHSPINVYIKRKSEPISNLISEIAGKKRMFHHH